MHNFGFLFAARESNRMKEMTKVNGVVIFLIAVAVALQLATFFVPFSNTKKLDTCQGFRDGFKNTNKEVSVDYCMLQQAIPGIAVAAGGLALLGLLSAIITHETGKAKTVKNFIDLILKPAKWLNISSCALLMLATAASIIAVFLQLFASDDLEKEKTGLRLSGTAVFFFVISLIGSCTNCFGKK